jgi:aspartate aminotransferase-like enzyme
MKKHFLFTPGPTPIPPESLLAMASQIDYHRSVEAVLQIKDVSEKLKQVFQTQNDVLILTSSGTGAMESIVSNLLSRGDEVIVIRSGKFGERWGEICSAYGVDFFSNRF